MNATIRQKPTDEHPFFRNERTRGSRLRTNTDTKLVRAVYLVVSLILCCDGFSPSKQQQQHQYHHRYTFRVSYKEEKTIGQDSAPWYNMQQQQQQRRNQPSKNIQPGGNDKSLYEILGNVSPTSSHDELKFRYNQLITNYEIIDNQDEMDAITTAWETLGDPIQRNKYDCYLKASTFTEKAQRWTALNFDHTVVTPAVTAILETWTEVSGWFSSSPSSSPSTSSSLNENLKDIPIDYLLDEIGDALQVADDALLVSTSINENDDEKGTSSSSSSMTPRLDMSMAIQIDDLINEIDAALQISDDALPVSTSANKECGENNTVGTSTNSSNPPKELSEESKDNTVSPADTGTPIEKKKERKMRNSAISPTKKWYYYFASEAVDNVQPIAAVNDDCDRHNDVAATTTSTINDETNEEEKSVSSVGTAITAYSTSLGDGVTTNSMMVENITTAELLQEKDTNMAKNTAHKSNEKKRMKEDAEAIVEAIKQQRLHQLYDDTDDNKNKLQVKAAEIAISRMSKEQQQSLEDMEIDVTEAENSIENTIKILEDQVKHVAMARSILEASRDMMIKSELDLLVCKKLVNEKVHELDRCLEMAKQKSNELDKLYLMKKNSTNKTQNKNEKNTHEENMSSDKDHHTQKRPQNHITVSPNDDDDVDDDEEEEEENQVHKGDDGDGVIDSALDDDDDDDDDVKPETALERSGPPDALSTLPDQSIREKEELISKKTSNAPLEKHTDALATLPDQSMREKEEPISKKTPKAPLEKHTDTQAQTGTISEDEIVLSKTKTTATVAVLKGKEDAEDIEDVEDKDIIKRTETETNRYETVVDDAISTTTSPPRPPSPSKNVNDAGYVAAVMEAWRKSQKIQVEKSIVEEEAKQARQKVESTIAESSRRPSRRDVDEEMLKGFKVIGEYNEEPKNAGNSNTKKKKKPSYHYPRRDSTSGRMKMPHYRTAEGRKAAAEQRARSAAVDAEVLERKSQEWVAEASDDYIESRYDRRHQTDRHDQHQSGSFATKGNGVDSNIGYFEPERDDDRWESTTSSHYGFDRPSIDPMRYREIMQTDYHVDIPISQVSKYNDPNRFRSANPRGYKTKSARRMDVNCHMQLMDHNWFDARRRQLSNPQL